MPCICYGAKSDKHEIDEFMENEKGQEMMKHLISAASILMAHKIDIECDMSNFQFREVFVTCFKHMIMGCDELKIS